MKLKIDHHELELDQPISIWKAARHLGIHIPTLCYEEGMEHFTSCMICMVKEMKSGRLLPACSAPVADGMEIETLNDEVRSFRRPTLARLHSDHVGERYGFTYVGRGFDLKIGVPLNKSLQDGLGHTTAQVIASCPTGALAQDKEHSP